MAAPSLEETVKGRIKLPPGLPRPNPTASVWQEPPHPTVADAQSSVLPATVDVAVIGSGITGCSVSHSLLKQSSTLRVTVVEARRAVSGATGRNGGHLISDSSSLVPKLVPVIGAEAAREMACFSEANKARIRDMVSELGDKEREAVELRNVTGTVAFEDADIFNAAVQEMKVLNEVNPASAHQQQTIPPDEAIQKYKYNDNIAGAAADHDAGALWPYRLITAVLRQLLDQYQDRFTLETNTPAQSIDHIDGAEYPYAIVTPRGVIRAKTVIHCTNGFAAHLLPNLVGRLYPLRGTMSAQQPGPSFPNLGSSVSWSYLGKPSFDQTTGVFSTGLYYAQQNARTGAIFIGGESQKLSDMLSSDDTVIATEAHETLSRILSRVYNKDAQPVGEQRLWSGIMGFTSDGLPLVGRLTKDLTARAGDGEWIAAGFNGHGMDKCWLTGEAVAEMIMGRTPEAFPKAFLVSEERCEKMGPDQALAMFMGL